MDDFDNITCEEYYKDEGYYDELERDHDEPYEPVVGCDSAEYEVVFTEQHIGTINNGIDGTDIYIQVKCDQPQEYWQVHDWVMQRYYRESSGPGSSFCTSCLVMAQQDVKDRFVAIIHYRYDV